MMGRKDVTWIAVVNGRQAHFFTKGAGKRLGGPKHTMTARPIRTNNESRRVLGRVFDRFGPARHIAEPRMEDKEQERKLFMRQVAEYLETSLVSKDYHHLIVVAPPKVLGTLRKSLGEAVKNAVTLELGKDLIHLSPEQIREHLSRVIYIQ